MHHSCRLLVLLLTASALAACGRKGAEALIGAQPDPTRAEARYLDPPQVLAVRGRAGESLVLEGRASPDSRIRAVTPDNKAYGATADHKGRFSLEIPPSNQPLVIALSEGEGRNMLQAEGWLFVPPDDPDRAVMLRAGAPARPLADGAGLIAATDFDSAGGAGVSGVAAPNTEVEVSLDGGAAVHVQSDARGVYAARLGVDHPIAAGTHQVKVTTHGQSLDRSLQFAAGTASQIVSASKEAGGWRLVWMMPGGGSQTTFVLTGAARS